MTELSNQIDAFKARRQRFVAAEVKYANKGRAEADIQQTKILETYLNSPILLPIPKEVFAGASEIAFPTIIMNKIEAIQRAVLKEFSGMTMYDLKSVRRSAEIVRARQIAMFISKEMTSSSMPGIGRRFGGRDNSTVRHAVERMEALVRKDPHFAAEIERIKASVPEVGI